MGIANVKIVGGKVSTFSLFFLKIAWFKKVFLNNCYAGMNKTGFLKILFKKTGFNTTCEHFIEILTYLFCPVEKNYNILLL